VPFSTAKEAANGYRLAKEKLLTTIFANWLRTPPFEFYAFSDKEDPKPNEK
jgi:hypothetical protein